MKPTSAKAIALFCTSLELGEEPISDELYWQAYQDLFFALKERGIEVYFTTGNDNYLGNGWFRNAYITDVRTADPKDLIEVTNIKVDLVFERSESDPFASHDIPVINPPAIRAIANNKIAIYKTFPSLQPFSIIANSPQELAAAINRMPGDKVVVKEQEGYGGDNVYIGPKTEVQSQVSNAPYPLLVQQFLDTSGGVPGQGKGVHDVRIEICGGEIINYYIRKAKPGSYHSNVHKGGSVKLLHTEDVPTELRQTVRQIDAHFASTPRFYAADFAHSDEGWKLIELNDYVGLRTADKDRLADYLVDVVTGNNATHPNEQLSSHVRDVRRTPVSSTQ